MKNKAYTHIFNDILSKVLQLSDSPSQFAEYLTQQIRELVGARTVVIATKTETEPTKIFNVFPARRTAWAQQKAVLKLAHLSNDFETIQYLSQKTSGQTIAILLQELSMDKAIVIPLMAARQKVGSILLLDIMDAYGIESVIELLTHLSGVFALIIRNSNLYQNMEAQVVLRTSELQQRNADLEEAILRAEESESQARDILLTAMDGFWINDMEGRIVEVNDVLCKMLGYSREEILTLSISDFEGQESVEQTKAHIERTIKLGLDRFESKHRRKNGELIDVEISVIMQPSRNLMVTFISDISVRKKAELALLESEERYRLAMQASNDGIFDWNLVTNEIYYSPGWKQMLGYEDHELPNDFSIWENTTHPDDVKKSWELQQQLISKQIDRFVLEFKMKHKDGHWVDILSQAEAIFNEEGVAIRIVGTHSDVTVRNKAEKEIKEINEMFSLYLCHSPIYTYIKEVTPDQSIVIQASENFIELTGISGKQMIGKNMEQLFPPEFAAKISKEDWEVCSGGNGLKLEEELNGKTYTTIKFPFRKGDRTLLAGYTIDITDRKIADQLLRDERQTLSNILEGTNCGTWNWNFQTGHATFNDRWAEIIGYTLGELEPINSDTWLNYIHPDDLPEAKTELNKLINKELAYYDVEFRQSHKDGRWIWVNSRGKVVEWMDNGKPLLISGIHIDITDRKRVECELIEAKERAQESDRLKSSFLANMSHEIRTPMNGILGFAELLKEPGLSGEDQQKYIGIIERSGARMLNTINDIVDISKIEAGLIQLDIKESNVNDQMEYIYTFFKPEVEAKGMKLYLNSAFLSQEVIILTDREKLYSILTNLVKNAIKFSEKGFIEFGYEIVEKKHEFSLQRQIQFYVTDTGIGIPRERQHAIFERFIQADIEDKRALQGSGLGLAITKSFVEMLGGQIWVESESGKGSVFYFTLPFHKVLVGESDFENISQAESANNQTNTEVVGLKILIAEDDETSEMFISILTKDLSREVLKARTGLEVIKICRENPDLDLILLDVQMPEMGGYTATREIRKFNKEVIIIAQTAYGLAGDRGKAIDAGCTDYISKPINKVLLMDLINKYCKKTR